MQLTKIISFQELTDSELSNQITHISNKLFKETITKIKKFFKLPRIYNDRIGHKLENKINQYLQVHNKKIINKDEQEKMFIILNEFYYFSTQHGSYSVVNLANYHAKLVKQLKEKNKEKDPIDQIIQNILSKIDQDMDTDEDDYYATASCLIKLKDNYKFINQPQTKYDKDLIIQHMTFLSYAASISFINSIAKYTAQQFSKYHIVNVNKQLFDEIEAGIKKYAIDLSPELNKLERIKEYYIK